MAYRQRFGLSEAKLAEYLGVSVPTIRKWTKEGGAPDAERQAAIRERLARDYAPPAEGATRQAARARVPRARALPTTGPARPTTPRSTREAGAARAQRGSGVAAADQAPSGPIVVTHPAAALAELLAAYVRSEGGQRLTPAQLIALGERLRRTLGA